MNQIGKAEVERQLLVYKNIGIDCKCLFTCKCIAIFQSNICNHRAGVKRRESPDWGGNTLLWALQQFLAMHQGRSKNPGWLFLLGMQGISISLISSPLTDVHSMFLYISLLKVKVTIPITCHLNRIVFSLTFVMWGIWYISAKIIVISVALAHGQCFH